MTLRLKLSGKPAIWTRRVMEQQVAHACTLCISQPHKLPPLPLINCGLPPPIPSQPILPTWSQVYSDSLWADLRSSLILKCNRGRRQGGWERIEAAPHWNRDTSVHKAIHKCQSHPQFLMCAWVNPSLLHVTCCTNRLTLNLLMMQLVICANLTDTEHSPGTSI